MKKNEANIKIEREGEKLKSVSISMPVWSKSSDTNNHLLVELPLLGLKTVAKDDIDVDKAIEEAIMSFCICSEKFGQRLENELLTLGWEVINEKSGDPIMGFSINEDMESADAVIDRIFRTADNYAKNNLNIEEGAVA